MKHHVFRSIVIGVALAALTVAFVPTLFAAQSGIGKEKTNAYQPQVESPMLNVAVKAGVAKNTSFVVAGIDYGDVIVQALTLDTATGAFTYAALTLDSVYWQDKTYDTLASGLNTDSLWILFFYYELTD